MALLCLDIGNTSGHFGIVEDGKVIEKWDVRTRRFIAATEEARESLARAARLEGLAFASVVPHATEGVRSLLTDLDLRIPAYQLRWDDAPGLGFDYPNPPEVGQDRLANAIGAQRLTGAPAVVIDMGTATSFDILTSKGYAGGAILPGLALMAEYLHEKTALLPRLDRTDLYTGSSIGKSTREAMQVGCSTGFRGMIKEVLINILEDLEKLGEHRPSVITTGSNAMVLPKDWWPDVKHVEELSILGLAEAFRRKHLQAGPIA